MAQNFNHTILVNWSEDSGAMRLHLLLSSAYFDRETFFCMYLQRHQGAEAWKRRRTQLANTDKADASVENRVDDWGHMVRSKRAIRLFRTRRR